MQIRRWLGLLSLLLPFKALASSLEDRISVNFDYYADNTDVQVYSPGFSFFKTLTKKFLIGIKMRIDAISAASIRKGGSPVRTDAVTGATARRTFDDVRYAPTLLGVYDDGDNTFTFGVYYSTERDYTGRSVFANYIRQLNLQNTAVGVGFSQSFDRWDPTFKRNLPRSNRKERKIDLSITQLLSPTSMVQLIYSNLYSEGFLGSPYHYLLRKDFARFETLPETRKGHAFAVKFVKLINEPTSINLSYRYYTDDWGIRSHTGDVKLLRDLTDTFTAGIRFRYYTQTKADFAKDLNSYTQTDRYVAVDYRLSSFSSNTVGILFIKSFGLSGIKLKGAVNYYRTSSNEYIRNWYGKDRIEGVFGSLSLDYTF